MYDTILFQRFLALMGCSIYFTFITVSLANQAANKCQYDLSDIDDDDKCNPPAKLVPNCPAQKLLVSYSAKLAPNMDTYSKVSKRFQLCKDCIGKSEMPNVYECSMNRGVCRNQRTIEFPKCHAGNMKELFKKEMPTGAHFADYFDIWILGIDFFPMNDYPCVIVEKGDYEFNCTNKEITFGLKTTTTVSTMGTTAEPNKQCTYTWEPLEKAVIKMDQGEGFDPFINYTLRVGYIEPSTNYSFENFVQDFLANYETKIEHVTQHVRKWMNANYEWIKDLPYNEYRYVPLPESVTADTKMMFCVVRCPSFNGAFAIAPTVYDEKLAGKWDLSKIEHNWKNDFDFLFYCYRDNIETIFHELTFSDQAAKNALTGHGIRMSFGIIYKKSFNHMSHLSAEQIEAHKYRFGISIPFRLPIYNQTADHYSAVDFYGVFFAPMEHAYKGKRTFSIEVHYIPLRYADLTGMEIATDDEESKKFWSNQTVTFFIRQENIECPNFNVTFPRINVIAQVTFQDEIYEFPFRFSALGVNNETGYMGHMMFRGRSKYELYRTIKKWIR